MKKIAFLFLLTREIERIDYWNNYFHYNYANIYIHNDKDKNNRIDYQLHKYHLIKNTQETKWGFILNAIYELFHQAFNNKDNEFFIICSESCIPLISFHLLYQYLFKTNKNIIELWKLDKYSFSKIQNIHKNHIKHSAFWILKRDMVQKLLIEKNYIMDNYNFESGEEYFLSYFYLKNKKHFINKISTFTDWKYNKNKIQLLYNKMKQAKTDDQYFIIKKKIALLSSHPKSYIDYIPNNLLNQNKYFFARKFLLSHKEIFLNNYQFDNIYIVSGLQRSGNHIFIKIIIESLNNKVFFINDIHKNTNIHKDNLFHSFIFNGHYLSKNINNLININEVNDTNIKKDLLISTEEYFIKDIQKLYNHFHNKNIKKIFIMRDLLNLTASRLQFMKNNNNTGFPMFTDKLFIQNWLDYFYYIQNNKYIFCLNYNKFILIKKKYITKQLKNIGINYNDNIIFNHTLFGKGSSFNNDKQNYLMRYKKYIHNKQIQYIIHNQKIKKILQKYFYINHL